MHLMIEISVTPIDNKIAVVKLTGRLDLTAAPELRSLLTKTVEQGYSHLGLDMGAVVAVDSSGLGALVSGLKTARLAGGDLRLAHLGQQPLLVLRTTTLDRVFALHDSVDAALVGYR